MSLKDQLKEAGANDLARQLESTKDYGVRISDMQNSIEPSALQQMRELLRVNEEVAKTALAFPAASYVPALDYVYETPKLMPIDPEERQAGEFMRGLKKQAERLQEAIQENQEVRMYCFDGNQEMQVLEISMPSNNVVALLCIDSEGNQTYLTGHMHSVRFSFVVHTLVPPQVRRLIGFNMA